MFSDGPKYAYKHLKLRKSCSFGNWSSSNGREYFLIIATLQIYCNLSTWKGQKQRGGLQLAIKHHKLAQKYKPLQRWRQKLNLSNLHIKKWKTVVKLCSCCFHWCTFRYCSRPFHELKPYWIALDCSKEGVVVRPSMSTGEKSKTLQDPCKPWTGECVWRKTANVA